MKSIFLRTGLGTLSTLLMFSVVVAKYKIKDLQVKPALEYAAHQDFQNIVIGAFPCETKEKTEQIFDTDKLIEKGYLLLLLVVENKNDFPVRLSEEFIFLIDESGRRLPAVHFVDVLLQLELKKGRSRYPSDREALAREVVEKEMFIDFEHKSFGDRTVAPLSSEQGVLFFRPDEVKDVSSYHVYIPEIWNVTENQPLIFFEFQLQ